jgi:hypothetical protein
MPSVRDNRHVADVEGTSVPMRCWKCEGTLRAERAIDITSSVASRFSCTRASVVAVAGMQGTSHDQWWLLDSYGLCELRYGPVSLNLHKTGGYDEAHA